MQINKLLMKNQAYKVAIKKASGDQGRSSLPVLPMFNLHQSLTR